jgi:16S rRNA G966 N2-methylase RsmD
MWSRALLVLDANIGWLSDESWVMAQIHPREYSALVLKNLEEIDQRRYGSTLLVFYEPKENP